MKKIIAVSAVLAANALPYTAQMAHAQTGYTDYSEMNLMSDARSELTRSASDNAQLTAFEFDPAISVNPNRGDFSTEIKIPLPPNLAGLSGLALKYDSQNPVNSGFGIGWSLNLPILERSRGSSASTPFTVSGLIGSGTLTRTAEDINALKGRAIGLLGLQNASAAMIIVTPYRFQVDPENYTLFVKVDHQAGNSLGWVAFQTSGIAWTFSADGVPTVLSDVHGNSLAFEWTGGLLRSIKDLAQGWHLDIAYNPMTRLFPQSTPQGIFPVPLGINQITIEHKQASRKAVYDFHYDGEYLAQVLQKNAVLPLFQGSYQAMQTQVSSAVNTLTATDEKYPIFNQSLETANYVSMDSYGEKDYLLVDLNGDGRTDRIYLGAEAMASEIKNTIDPLIKWSFDHIDKGRGPADESGKYNGIIAGIQSRNAQSMHVDLAVWDKSSNATTFKTDSSLDLGKFGLQIAPTTMSFVVGDKTVSYKSDTTQNGLYFVDLYGTGRKAAVFCPGDKAADDQRITLPDGKHSMSNLHMSILSLVAPGQVAGHVGGKAFTNTLVFAGSSARVLEQTTNEAELKRRWNEVRDHADIYVTTNALLNVSQWVERSEAFRCNQYSLFFDANGDGTIDVLTGRTLYLRHQGLNGVTVQTVVLSDDQLKNLFSAPEQISFDHWKHVLAWNNTNGRFELRNGFYYANPATGRMHLDQFGTGVVTSPAPAQKLLTKITSPFGGEIRLGYELKDGVWAIASTVKDGNNNSTVSSGNATTPGKSPLIESTYFYDTPNRDPFTGIFTGFHVTREIEKILSPLALVAPREIVRTFLSDTSTAVVHYQSRARMQGYAVEEIVKKPDVENYYSSKYNEWSISSLYQGEDHPALSAEYGDRWVLFPAKVEEKEYNEARNVISAKRTKRRMQEWQMDQNAGGLVPTKTLRRIEDAMGLENQYGGDGMIPEVGNFYETVEILPSLYRAALIEKRSTGKNNKAFRQPIVFQNNAVGDHNRACQGEICFTYTHDALGRLIRQESNQGRFSEQTYQDDSPVLATLKNQDTDGKQFQATSDPLTGRYTEIISPEGRSQRLDYSVDGVLKSVKSKNASLALFTDRMTLTLPASKSEDGIMFYADPVILKVDDRLETVEFDGFGRVFRKQTFTPDGILYSGETVYGDKNKPLMTSLPSFSSFQDVSNQTLWGASKQWDALGRISVDWTSADGMWKYEYGNNCVGKKLNHALETDICYNIFGKPTSMNHYGESTWYKTNFLGDILSNSDSKSWSYDIHGEPISTLAGNGKTAGDAAAWNESATIDHLSRTSEDAMGWFKRFDAVGRLVETKRTKTSQPTDIIEKREYSFGKLSKAHAMDNTGKVIPAFEQAFDYDAAGNPISAKVGGLTVSRQYDAFDRLIKEDIGTGWLNSTSVAYSYENGRLTSIPGVISSVQRNEDGHITSLAYANGLTLNRSYAQHSLRPGEITVATVAKPSTPQFTESYEYDTSTNLLTSRKVETMLVQIPQAPQSAETFKHTSPGSHGFGIFLDDSPTVQESRALPRDRDHGRLQTLDTDKGQQPLSSPLTWPLKWNDDNLAGYKGHTFYYNAEGSLLAACPSDKSIGDKACMLRISADRVVIDGTIVSLIRVDGLPVAVQVGKVTYPVVADHLGSIRAMWSADGSEMLWARRYSAWGEKSVTFTSKHRSDAERLEQQCVWGYANFIEIPGVGSDIYWSASRAYAPSIKEWLSPDPMVKWNPRLAATKPGNWASTRYANNSPLTYVDPSGRNVYKASLSISAVVAGLGASAGIGIAVGRDNDGNFSGGLSFSSATGPTAGLGAGTSFSVGEDNSERVASGISYDHSYGGSGIYGLGVGAELTKSTDENGEKSTGWNASIAGGAELEVHSIDGITKTETFSDIGSDFKDFFSNDLDRGNDYSQSGGSSSVNSWKDPENSCRKSDF